MKWSHQQPREWKYIATKNLCCTPVCAHQNHINATSFHRATYFARSDFFVLAHANANFIINLSHSPMRKYFKNNNNNRWHMAHTYRTAIYESAIWIMMKFCHSLIWGFWLRVAVGRCRNVWGDLKITKKCGPESGRHDAATSTINNFHRKCNETHSVHFLKRILIRFVENNNNDANNFPLQQQKCH